MKRNLFLTLTLALSLSFIACDKKTKGDSLSDSEIGLRKTSVENENSVALLGDINFSSTQPGESVVFDRSFENAPPLIPHDIEAMIPITKDNNMCLSCHIKEMAADLGTKPAPASHYFGFQSNKSTGDVVSNERFSCDQCHVPQSNAKPLVGNKFEAVFTDESLKKSSDLMQTIQEGVK